MVEICGVGERKRIILFKDYVLREIWVKFVFEEIWDNWEGIKDFIGIGYLSFLEKML